MASYPVYLDYNATTPLDRSVIEEIHKSLCKTWGNPSSNNTLGIEARNVVEKSRNFVAAMINATSEDIVFTSGGTEANNMAIISAIKDSRNEQPKKPHAITSNVEHDSVIKVLANLEKNAQIEFSVAEVNKKTGCLDWDSVMNLIKSNTCLITIMHANNETGVMMPIEEIGENLKRLNVERVKKKLPYIYFHTDAAQSLGKVPVNVQELGVDYLTIVGHKFYGPRIGALYARNIMTSTPVYPLVQGGGQERGYRPGTENTAMIAGLGHAAKLVDENLESYSKTMKDVCDYFSQKLQERIPGLSINFNKTGNRLPNTLSIQVPEGFLAEIVLEKCRDKIFASLGAACHSHTGEPSGILISSGLSPNEARRTLRLSVGRTTTFHEIDLAVNALADACISDLSE